MIQQKFIIFLNKRGTICQCGNTFRFEKVNASICKTKCYGNNNQLCGVDKYFSVYSTIGFDFKLLIFLKFDLITIEKKKI